MLHALSGTEALQENRSRVIPRGVRLAALGVLCGALAVSAWMSGTGSWFRGPWAPEPPSWERLSVPAALLAVPPADLPGAVRDRLEREPGRGPRGCRCSRRAGSSGTPGADRRRW